MKVQGWTTIYTVLLFCLFTAGNTSHGQAMKDANLYVATDGNDAWSGRLLAPNTDKTDGPFATLARARGAMRAEKAEKTCYVRGGVYYLAEPLVLTPEDSGAAFLAYPGEKAVLSGGRPITDWQKGEGNIWMAQIPDVKAGKWYAQQLFVDGERQVRARHPNYDPRNPTQGGFLFARIQWAGAFNAALDRMYPGDWAEYDLDVPAEGDYIVWVRYAALNKPFGTDNIGGRTTVKVDGQPPVPLMNLPDTGSWRTYKWSPQASATLHLTAGKHTLRWTNDKGPGLDNDAFALTDDPAWRPREGKLPQPAAGRQLLIVQCESYDRIHGDKATVSGWASGDTVCFPRGTLQAWPKSPEKILHIWIYEDCGLCSNTLAPIAQIDEAKAQLRLTQTMDFGAFEGMRFFVDNVREALDAPGEWYLDRATGVLTYWPQREDFAKGRAVASALDRLIEVNGAERIRFEGFTFEATEYGFQKDNWYHSEYSAVWLRAAARCRFAHNRFVNLGGTAMVLNGTCTENEIVANEVADAGAGGFTINSSPGNFYGKDPKGNANCPPLAQRNLVSGNHIHDIGVIWKHGAGIYLHATGHNTLSHNYIHDTSRHPIIVTFNCGGNVIEYNEIMHTNLETGDTGAIHTYETIYAKEGNIIRNNVIGDVIGMGTTKDGKFLSPHYAWGIYLDGESSNTLVRDNIVFRNVLGGVMMNSGQNNIWENNIFVDSRESQVHYSNYSGKGKGNRIMRNIFCFSGAKAIIGKLGPKEGPTFLDSDYNVFWHAGQPLPELADLQKRGFDMHSILADPLFADPAKDDYRLKPDSPAFKLGFKPIGTSRVGLKGFVDRNPK